LEYKEIKPCTDLEPFIHSFWELKGKHHDRQWERIFPDGCAGLVMNLGDCCFTDNGSVTMEFGRTYAVGTLTSFKDSFIDSNTHLLGVCLKPGAFANFFHYAPQNELTDLTIQLEKANSFDVDKLLGDPSNYLNRFFSAKIRSKKRPLHTVINDIHHSNGQLSIHELSKRNYTTLRQLERSFKQYIGITPKEYSSIIRFQKALSIIQKRSAKLNLLEIAFECGFYDHSHLANEIKRNTGLPPSQL
jgi:AraC-like DNA-binding protein